MIKQINCMFIFINNIVGFENNNKNKEIEYINLFKITV